MKTKVIHIREYLPSIISTGKAIKEIRESISFDNNCKYIFDFSGIFFISRSFADEFYKFVTNSNIDYSILNANKNIEEMLNAVSRISKKDIKTDTDEITFTYFKNINELHSFLSSF